MTKVYLAGPYAAREYLKRASGVLIIAGHEPTSHWVNSEHEITHGTVGAALDQDDAYIAEHTRGDLAGVDRADVVLLFTGNYLESVESCPGPAHTGGRHIETGYALAKGKRVIVIGEPENIFHRGCCEIVGTFQAAVAVLNQD